MLYVISNPIVVDDGVMVEVGNTVVLVVVVVITLVDSEGGETEELLGGGFCEGLAEVDNIKSGMDTELIDMNMEELVASGD